MKSTFFSLPIALVLSGCGLFHDIEIYPLNEQTTDGGKCPDPPDLAPPVAPCAAAKGLPGDNLLCVDFSAFSDQPLGASLPPQLNGWDFVTNCGGMNWEIRDHKLQIKNFGGFMSSCGFLLPSRTDYQKYSRFTLSAVWKLQLDSSTQKVQVMLGGDDQDKLLLDWLTGKQPRKQWVQSVDKADLPAAASGAFQPLFKITSGAMIGTSSWQIESIALNGSM